MGRSPLARIRAIFALVIIIVAIVAGPMLSVGRAQGWFANAPLLQQAVLASPLGDNSSDNGGDNGGDNSGDNSGDNGGDNSNGNGNGNGNDNIAPTFTPIPTDTPIATATFTPIPTNTPIPTATLTPTPPPVCSPRPQVGVTTAPAGSGRLQVTLSANGTNNRLAQLQFQQTTNAVVDVGNQSGAQGAFTVDLSDHPQQLTFFVRRVNAGAAVTVPLVVVDGCGSWPTLVGGGPNAF
jgi:hypothetical protein